MMTDPIADMLARVRNAALAQHASTRIPASKLKHNIAKLLKEAGYVGDVRLEESPITKRPEIVVALKYDRDRMCAFQGIRRVSRPGRRVYVHHNQIPRVLSGLGTSILSTSQGLMTDTEARRRKVGGELVCEVW
jgi:small subunit ribosomal protein S8